MQVHYRYILVLIKLMPFATANWISHGVRQVEDGIKARHIEDTAGELLDLLDAFEDADGRHRHRHHDTGTTVTEVLKQTVTASAATLESTPPVTVTLNGTVTTVTVDSNDGPLTILTTTVFAQGAAPTQTIGLLPDTVTQTVYVTMPCANSPALGSTNATLAASTESIASSSSSSISSSNSSVEVSVVPVSSSVSSTSVSASVLTTLSPSLNSTTSTASTSPSPSPSSTLESALTFGIGTSTAAAVAANNPAAVTPPPAAATSSSSAQVPDIDTSGLTLMTVLSLGNLMQQHTVLPATL